MNALRLVPISLVLILLAAGCGGGGGGGDDGGGDDPSPPIVTGPISSDPGEVDFGEVLPGDGGQMRIDVESTSDDTPLTITAITASGDGVEVQGLPALPLTLDPREEFALTVSFTALDLGTLDGEVRVVHDLGTLVVPVRATTGGLEIVDFGSQGLIFGRTPELTVNVPSDAVSLTIEGLMGDGDYLELLELRGPGGRLYTDGSLGNLTFDEGRQVFSTTVPNTDRSSLELVSGGGEYTFRLRRTYGSGSTMRVRALIQRRPGANRGVGSIDLNVFFAPAVRPTAATAASDGRLQAILGSMESVLGQQGMSVDRVSYFDLDDPRYDDVSETEFRDLLKESAAAPEVGVNLFFARTILRSGVAGAAGAVSGPYRNGTRASGVGVRYTDTLNTFTIGAVVAHEVGHLFGLYHTVDPDGTHDIIDDTPNCPPDGTDDECAIRGGLLLMHWEYLAATVLTDGQGFVMRRHPLVGAAYPAGSGPSLLSLPPDPSELEPLPSGWCGSCATK